MLFMSLAVMFHIVIITLHMNAYPIIVIVPIKHSDLMYIVGDSERWS